MLLYNSTPQNDITPDKVPDLNKLGIWIRTGSIYIGELSEEPEGDEPEDYEEYEEDYIQSYSLLQLENLGEFLRGFVSLCNGFEVDYHKKFRTKFYGNPIDHYGTQYDIEDFLLSHLFDIDNEISKRYEEKSKEISELEGKKGHARHHIIKLEKSIIKLEETRIKLEADLNYYLSKEIKIEDEIQKMNDELENVTIGRATKRAI